MTGESKVKNTAINIIQYGLKSHNSSTKATVLTRIVNVIP
jgi:hypothetical protein